MQLESITNDILAPKMGGCSSSSSALMIAASKYAASQSFPAGCVLARKTSDGKLYPYAEPNDAQTITVAGSISGGSFRIGAVDKNGVLQYTDAIAYNANAAAIQTALNAVLGASAVAVTGSALGTGITVTFSGTGYAALKQPLLMVNLSALTGATTASVAHAAYDGTDVAVGLQHEAIVTDASGNIFLGDSTTANSLNVPHNSSSFFVSGIFDTAQLTGWDAGAAADLGAETLPNGYIRIR